MALLMIFKPGTQGPNQHGAQTPPNGTGVMIAGLALPILGFIGGILAAISIPAYQQYAERAKATQMQSTTPADNAQPAEEAPPVSPEQ